MLWDSTQAVQGKCTLTMTSSLLAQRAGEHCLGTFRATGRPTLHDQIAGPETYHPATRRFGRYCINLCPPPPKKKTWPLSSDTYYFYQGLFPKFKANIFSETVISKRCSIVIMYLCTFYPVQSQLQMMTVILSPALFQSEVNLVEIQVRSSRGNILYNENKTILQTC